MIFKLSFTMRKIFASKSTFRHILININFAMETRSKAQQKRDRHAICRAILRQPGPGVEDIAFIDSNMEIGESN